MRSRRTALGAADYKLNGQAPGRHKRVHVLHVSGGYVVAAASEEGGVVTNGTSNCARDGRTRTLRFRHADPRGFPRTKGTLGGVRYQQQLERGSFAQAEELSRACAAGGGFFSRTGAEHGRLAFSRRIVPV